MQLLIILIILALFIGLVGVNKEGFVNWAVSPSSIKQFNDLGVRNHPYTGHSVMYPTHLFPGYKYYKYKKPYFGKCPNQKCNIQ